MKHKSVWLASVLILGSDVIWAQQPEARATQLVVSKATGEFSWQLGDASPSLQYSGKLVGSSLDARLQQGSEVYVTISGASDRQSMNFTAQFSDLGQARFQFSPSAQPAVSSEQISAADCRRIEQSEWFRSAAAAVPNLTRDLALAADEAERVRAGSILAALDFVTELPKHLKQCTSDGAR
jgi:hypothetical protein